MAEGDGRTAAGAKAPADRVARRVAGSTATGGRVQIARRPARGWTDRKRRKFLEVLRATSNVAESARQARMSQGSAYDFRKRDPGFAAEWELALEEGYSELEMLLLRQSIYGTTTTEVIDDGDEGKPRRTKTVHSYPHGTALRLLFAHRDTVAAVRERRQLERPDGEALRERIMRELAEVRARSEDSDEDDDEENGGGGDSA